MYLLVTYLMRYGHSISQDTIEDYSNVTNTIFQLLPNTKCQDVFSSTTRSACLQQCKVRYWNSQQLPVLCNYVHYLFIILAVSKAAGQYICLKRMYTAH